MAMLPCTDGDYKRGECFGLAAGAGREAQSRILLRLGMLAEAGKIFLCAREFIAVFPKAARRVRFF